MARDTPVGKKPPLELEVGKINPSGPLVRSNLKRISGMDVDSLRRHKITALWSKYDLTPVQKMYLTELLERKLKQSSEYAEIQRSVAKGLAQPRTAEDFMALTPSDVSNLKLQPLQRIIRGEVAVQPGVKAAARKAFNTTYRRPTSCEPGVTGFDVWEDPETGEKYSNRDPALPSLSEHPRYSVRAARLHVNGEWAPGVLIKNGFWMMTTDVSGSCIQEQRTLTRPEGGESMDLRDFQRLAPTGALGQAVLLDPESLERGKLVDAKQGESLDFGRGGPDCRGVCLLVLAGLGVLAGLAWS